MAGTGIVTPDNPRGLQLFPNGDLDIPRGVDVVVKDVSQELQRVLDAVANVVLYATSTTAQTVAYGQMTFTVEAGRTFLSPLPRVRISDTVSEFRWLEGKVLSYIGTTLLVDIDQISGSGSNSSWWVGVAGEPAVKANGVRSTNGSAGLTMLTTDRDVSVISSSNKVFTLLSPSAFVLGVTYKFRQFGTAILTIQGTVYDAGGEVSSMVLTDGEMLALCRYTKLDGTAGLCIDSQGA